MASIEKRKLKKGVCYCLVFYRNGKKQKISFDSSYKHSSVTTAKSALEQFLEAEKMGEPLPRAAKSYFDDAPPDVLKRFSSLGFSVAKKSLKISDAWKEYLDYKTSTVKGSTVVKATTVYDRFVKAFGEDVYFRDLTEESARRFRSELAKKYAQATVASTIAILRTFVNWAIRNDFVEENVFLSVERGTMVNTSRDFHVPKEWGAKIFDACPSQSWRTLFALWRFGGLRQQEPLGLTVSSVDFVNKKLAVHATKTEKYAQGGNRFIPLFPVLEREITAQIKEVPKGENFLIFSNRRKSFDSGFIKILKTAGIEK